MNANRILAIDPGTEVSGVVLFDPMTRSVVEAGVEPNREVRGRIVRCIHEQVAIEMVASYGMAVGAEVFDTCVHIGRMVQAHRHPDDVRLVFRKAVKLHLCGSARAKDANIRAAVIDLYGGKAKAIGTSKQPGPLYAVKSHAWQALALAITVADGAA